MKTIDVLVSDVISNMSLDIDNESVGINVDIAESDNLIPIAYWHIDEWIEDAESVVPAIANAINLFHTNKLELLNRLGYSTHINEDRVMLVTFNVL